MDEITRRTNETESIVVLGDSVDYCFAALITKIHILETTINWKLFCNFIDIFIDHCNLFLAVCRQNK